MNKVIVITGATSGFGKAMAEKFSMPEYKLVLVARTPLAQGASYWRRGDC